MSQADDWQNCCYYWGKYRCHYKLLDTKIQISCPRKWLCVQNFWRVCFLFISWLKM